MTDSGRSILVLGPHRSGTSAVARVLNLLGVELGSQMLPPTADNRYGFWEHRDIFELHERLLGRLGFAWHEIRPLPSGWRRLDGVEEIRGELRDVLVREFGGAALWGVKDPRLSRLLPLWLDLLDDLGSESRFVIVVRNPLEVVDSLRRREDFSFEKSLLLYMSEMVMALHHTRGRRRAFVSFAGLLEDWRRTIGSLSRQLEVEWPHPVTRREGEVDAFLRPSARHHRHSAADLRDHPAVPDWCAELHEALEAACRGDDHDLGTVSRRAHDAFVSTTALLLPELDRLRREVVRLEQRAARTQSELTKVQGHLTSILSGRLYRFSRMPRRLLHLLGRLR